MLKVEEVYKSYGSLQILNNVNLEVKKGELVAITGASGAGKSTLMHIIGSLDKPDKGKVYIENKLISDLKDKEISAFRNQNIGFVFQFHHLLPEFTALENICIPAFINRVDKKTAETRAKELLQELKLEHRIHHKPNELSGGEQQRVAVARALINRPAVILADEPSGNLDSKSAEELHQLFFKLRQELNQTFVIVTHNLAFAAQGDRTLTIMDGVIL